MPSKKLRRLYVFPHALAKKSLELVPCNQKFRKYGETLSPLRKKTCIATEDGTIKRREKQTNKLDTYIRINGERTCILRQDYINY